jgi:hypothetical protein
MGLFSRQHDHARHRDAADCRNSARPTQAGLYHVGRRIAGYLKIACGLLLALSLPAQSQPLRIATYNVELQRDGPGLLLRDLARGKDPQIAAVLDVIATADADVLAIQNFDYDLTAEALSILAKAADYPHYFALRPNAGMPTGLDMDGDGKLGGPADAQGYGRFSGHGGMAILSRYPILTDSVQDLSDLLWKDVPDALLPVTADGPFPSADALAVQRLSTTGHWIVPIDVPKGQFDLMTFHASPPVFDGPEDRNGRRNHDEIRLWQQVLDGDIGTAPANRFVIAGDANLDPDDSDGIRSAISGLQSTICWQICASETCAPLVLPAQIPSTGPIPCPAICESIMCFRQFIGQCWTLASCGLRQMILKPGPWPPQAATGSFGSTWDIDPAVLCG